MKVQKFEVTEVKLEIKDPSIFDDTSLIPGDAYQKCEIEIHGINAGFTAALRACMIDEIPVRGMTIEGNYMEHISGREDEIDTYVLPEVLLKSIQAVRINQTIDIPKDVTAHLDVTNNSMDPIYITTNHLVLTTSKKEVIKGVIPPNIPLCVLGPRKHLKVSKIVIVTGKAHFDRATADANLFSGLPIFGYRQLDGLDQSCLVYEAKDYAISFKTYYGDSAIRLVKLACKEIVSRLETLIENIEWLSKKSKEDVNNYLSVIANTEAKKYTFLLETRSLILGVAYYIKGLGIISAHDVNNETQSHSILSVFHPDADAVVIKACKNMIADFKTLLEYHKK